MVLVHPTATDNHAHDVGAVGGGRKESLFLLFFVSTRTYSDSSRATSSSLTTLIYASPRIWSAIARSCTFERAIAGSSSTRSHVSRSTDSISSFVPCKDR